MKESHPVGPIVHDLRRPAFVIHQDFQLFFPEDEMGLISYT
jgi:hypothetical protein